MVSLPASAGDVRLEGNGLSMHVGSTRGYGVMSALKRVGLINANAFRDAEYRRGLRRLSRRIKNGRVVVGDHIGGNLSGMIADVTDINEMSLPVWITGKYCYSACTIFLGSHQVCISRTTQFGFHKPKPEIHKGQLEHGIIQRAIQRAGEYYNATLRNWWIRTGSKSTSLINISGSELIRIGYKECPKSSRRVP